MPITFPIAAARPHFCAIVSPATPEPGTMVAMPERLIPVVCAVISRDGRILATQRAAGQHLAGSWEFPGGKVESGERPEDALSREITEELGCTIAVGEKITTTEHTYDFGTIALTSYWATLIDGHPHLTEHADARWLQADELDSVEWAPADVPTVAKVTSRPTIS